MTKWIYGKLKLKISYDPPAMEKVQKIQEGVDEIRFLEKFNRSAEEYKNQRVEISRLTTVVNITEELHRKVAEGLYISSSIKVVSDRWMDDKEEILVESKKQAYKKKSVEKGRIPDT